MEESNYNGNAVPKQNDRTISTFDRARGEWVGIAMFTKPSTVQHIEPVSGKNETFVVSTARHNELGDMIFVECMNETGVTRVALPPKVARAIHRQADSLATRSRSRRAKAAAQARRDAGIVPFQKK